MNSHTTKEAADFAPKTPVDTGPRRLLPSGRSVVVRTAGNQEELEVRSPDGKVEVCITLTEQGAVVSLQASRLELGSPDTMALNCRRLQINTAEGTDLLSGGDVCITGREMRVQAKSDIHMNGGVIHLNC